MTLDLTRVDRQFRNGLLVIALLLGVLDYFYGGDNPWFRAGFVICIAGLVGYFTNFLAIKMLFQPKQGKVLGWQGLVPKNKAQIARSLGESVQEQLLSPDIILAYIRDRHLIERGTEGLADWVDDHLQDEDIRRQITTTLIELMTDRGPDFLTTSFDQIETVLKNLAHNPEAIDRGWDKFRRALSDFLHNSENRRWLAERTRHLLSQQLPQIADWINRGLVDYLRNRRRLGGLGLGLKNIFSFDEAAILQLLDRFTNDPEMSQDFVAMLDTLVDEIQREIASPETQQVIQQQLADWVDVLSNKARQSLLPATIEQLQHYLNNPDNWQQIEDLLISSLQWLKERGVTLLNSETGQRWLRNVIEQAVHKLNVTELVEEQVMGLDTDELEKMVLDNTGGNLTIIQILGGCLGLIAGTVQVHLAFALPIAGLVGVVWIAWRINESRSYV